VPDVALGEPRLLVCLPMSVSATLTLAPGQVTVAAPSGTGGTPAAVTDGGARAGMRRHK